MNVQTEQKFKQNYCLSSSTSVVDPADIGLVGGEKFVEHSRIQITLIYHWPTPNFK